tara:strand:+ start:337 stop:1221 length:885 start_codon:yes stop_codon:yes gene_type:complete
MNLNYEKIVYGGSLEAFLFAYKNNLPVLYTNLKPPFLFDYLQPVDEFSKLNIKSPPNVLNSSTGVISYGPSKVQLWQKLYFLLSMSGKIIYGDTVRSVSIEGQEAYINCGTAKRKSIQFDQIVIFDDIGISGLSEIKKQIKSKSIIYDWVDITSGGSHAYDVFHYDDDFVNTVYFYPSQRNDNKKLKDLVCISYLNDDQIDDFSYSSTYVKFKLLELFKEQGIKGARNGRDPNRPGKYKYYSVKLEPTKREVIPQVANEYCEDDRFIFFDGSLEQVIQESYMCDGYLKRISEII